jgi:hypothetical protein
MAKSYPKRYEPLVLVMMIKNEKRIKLTFDSVKDWIGEFFIYDTGSTDDTVERVTNYCKEHDIILHLKQGTFTNFSVSRNELLDYTEEILKGKERYMLMLDANDEMQNMDVLIKTIKDISTKGDWCGYYLTQRWQTGHSLESYYNVRMVKTHYNWRYDKKAIVHEYIMCPLISEKIKKDEEIVYRIEGVYIYQDRTKDDDKSFRRFARDKVMLYNEYLKDPQEPRTLFYLAQTCSCLGLHDEAYKYYLARIKVIGFHEEMYQSYFRLGEIAYYLLKHDWEESFNWFMKAYQHSQRAEPLLKIAEYYADNNLYQEKKSEWHTCYMFASMACNLVFPNNQILFIDKRCYTYKRWHILGMAAFHVGRYREGKDACLRAIEAENADIDKFNLKFYLKKDIEIMGDQKITSPSLIAVTHGSTEIRTKEETDAKFDKASILIKIVDEVVTEEKSNGKNIPNAIITILKNINAIPNIQPDINSNSVQHNRRDRRAMLRNIINQRHNSLSQSNVNQESNQPINNEPIPIEVEESKSVEYTEKNKKKLKKRNKKGR